MDEFTRRFDDTDHTQELRAGRMANDNNPEDEQAGASSSEFTQVSPRNVEPPKYAIPDSDPLDQTLEGPRLSRANDVQHHLDMQNQAQNNVPTARGPAHPPQPIPSIQS